MGSLIDTSKLRTINLAHGVSATYLFTYENDAIKACVHELKYGGLADITSPVIEAVAYRFLTSLQALVGSNPVWIPVPSSRRHLRERGFTQTVGIAHAWAEILGGTVWQGAILHTSQSAQVGSSATQRRIQAQGAYVWRGYDAEKYVGKTWVIVDDVCTTGSTLSACYECLLPHTDKPIRSLVLARQE